MNTMNASTTATSEILGEGTLVGRHRVVGKLAEGAQAIVYIGEHVVTRAQVAIKVLRRCHCGSREMIARFEREARVMGRVAGCGTIVQIHDAGTLADARPFLVTEFVRGRELSTLLSNARRRDVTMDLERVLTIGRDLAAALRDAHGRGVVHRDLKPSNVMIARMPDGREVAKLVDFGVSGDLAVRGTSPELTRAGSVVGTLEYMSPEQAAGQPASVSMDIYALGVVLFEMTTGTLPPSHGLRRGTVPRIAGLRADIPQALDALVSRCLCADPTARVADAVEVLSRLAAAHDQLGASAPSHVWAQGRPVRAAGAIQVTPDGMVTPEDGVDGPASARRVAPRTVSCPAGRAPRLGRFRRRGRPMLRVVGLVVVVAAGLLTGIAIWRLGLRATRDATDRAAMPTRFDTG